MTTSRSDLDISRVRTDINQELLFCSVGMYKLFLAHGEAGHDAKELYLHLLFTSRLQETRAVRAKNTYLAKGLGWGVVRVKRAKAWLKEHHIISYVRRRKSDGTLGETYILIDRIADVPSDVAADGPETEPVDDSQVWFDFSPDPATDYREMHATESGVLFDPDIQPTSTTDESAQSDDSRDIATDAAAAGAPLPKSAVNLQSTTDVNSTTGIDIHPVVEPPCGAKQQMLKINNEMLKTRKENLFSPLGESRERLSTSREQNPARELTQKARVYWITEYTERWNRPPRFAAAEADLLKRDIERIGLESFTTATDVFFADLVPDVVRFVTERGAGYGYRVFTTQVDKILEHIERVTTRVEATRARASPPSSCPSCGKTLVYAEDRCGCHTCRVYYDYDPGTNEWVRDTETTAVTYIVKGGRGIEIEEVAWNEVNV